MGRVKGREKVCKVTVVGKRTRRVETGGINGLCSFGIEGMMIWRGRRKRRGGGI